MKKFEIPKYYRSSIIAEIKEGRKDSDPRKKDFKPTLLDFGPVKFYIARHFGFCYGVENAIEIAYNAIEANPGKRIFLLSEMIHNPGVNSDLQSMGARFLMDTSGNKLIDFNELSPEDIVIIPAFGTTVEIENVLKDKGIDPYKYNTTCPFVEKVWNRSRQLGESDHTIIIHGKHYHEETRATFSHSVQNGSPALIVRDLNEAKVLSEMILGNKSREDFYEYFQDKYSEGFDFINDLKKIGVVNQTTMLATETQAIADLLKDTMVKKFGAENLTDHFADTRDTLCYATYDNQQATEGLLKTEADFAVVVGGYNSSNTSHIVELCEEKIKTYFISSADKILPGGAISHYDIHSKTEKTTGNFIPKDMPVKILVTSGASCPDAVVDEVIRKLLTFFEGTDEIGNAVERAISAG